MIGLRRLQLSRAKHPSLAGHPRIPQFLARAVPHYEYGEDEFFAADDAPEDVQLRQVAYLRAKLERKAG